MGLTNTLEEDKKSRLRCGFMAKILEQGLALHELVGMETSFEREVQGESGGDQSPPTADAAWRDAVPHHRRNSPIVKAWLHTGRVIFLRKLGSTAAAEAPRWEYNCGHPRRVKRHGVF